MTQTRGNGSDGLSDADDRLARVERLTELPLLLLSFCMVPLLLGPLLWEMSSTEETLFFALDTVIWAIFVVEIVVKFAIAQDRIGFLLGHWLELIVVVVPPFRPLRIFRLVLFGSRAIRYSRRLANIDYLGVYAVGLVLIGSTIVAAVENWRGRGDTELHRRTLVGACHRHHGGVRRRYACYGGWKDCCHVPDRWWRRSVWRPDGQPRVLVYPLEQPEAQGRVGGYGRTHDRGFENCGRRLPA